MPTVGVLALQGAFSEHIQLLNKASTEHANRNYTWNFLEVRSLEELNLCDALIIPGGESTTISLVAARSGILEGLREFVKVKRKPTWGTCAGLILLAESATRTKKGGQELIGGLDVRVNRNYFGRQAESFTSQVDLAFLSELDDDNENGDSSSNRPKHPFQAVFIRAPIVESVLSPVHGIQKDEALKPDTIVAPSRTAGDKVSKPLLNSEVEILARLEGPGNKGDIIAVCQGNCFGTSFHPELTNDSRIHVWWLGKVISSLLSVMT